MEIIPAIDLLQGSCVRLNQGDYKKVTQFNDDPVAQALRWQQQILCLVFKNVIIGNYFYILMIVINFLYFGVCTSYCI